MADYSSSTNNNSQPYILSPKSTTGSLLSPQTLQSSEESFLEMRPHKPDMASQNKKLLPSNSSNKLVTTATSSLGKFQLTATTTIIMPPNHFVNKNETMKEVSSLLLSPQDLNDEASSNGFHHHHHLKTKQSSSSNQSISNMSKNQSTSCLHKNSSGASSSQFQDKRASLNAYQRKVVELNLNPGSQITGSKIQSNDYMGVKIIPQSTKNQKQLSLDMTSTLGSSTALLFSAHNLHTARQASNKTLEKQTSSSSIHDHSHHHLRNNKDISSVLNNHTNLIKCGHIGNKLTHLSPKNQIVNYAASPRISISASSVSNIMSKNKLTIRKQPVLLSKTSALNRSEAANVTNQEMSKLGGVNVSQQQNYSSKQGSPQQPFGIKTGQNSGEKKGQTLISKNLSSERQLQIKTCQDDPRASISARLTIGCSSVTNSSSKQKAFQSKRDSLPRYYSPSSSQTHMSIHKALSRISSVGELQRAKKEIASQRKSIQGQKMQNSAKRMTSMQTASQIVAAAKNNSRHTTLLMSPEATSNQYDDYGYQTEQQYQQTNDDLVGEAGDEDLQFLEYSTPQEKLWFALETRQSLKIIEDLLARKDVKVDQKNAFDDGWTALHYATHEGYVEAVKLLVEKYKCAIDPRSSTNKTPFHLACIRGESTLINYLLQAGASTCAVDRDGCTPLHYLCENEHRDMIKLVLPLSHGAQDVRNRFGMKPYDMIKDRDFKREIRTIIHQHSHNHQRKISLGSGSRQRPGLDKPRTSNSRDRTENSQQYNHLNNNVKIHKISEEKMQESLGQLFRKFSLFKNTAFSNRGTVSKDRQIESKEFSIEKQAEKSRQQAKNMGSPKPNTNRLTIGGGINTNQMKQNTHTTTSSRQLPQSCKNQTVKTTQPCASKPLTTQSHSNLLSKNVSPNKGGALNNRKAVGAIATQKKPIETTMNLSQSQRNIQPLKPQNTNQQKSEQKGIQGTYKSLAPTKSQAQIKPYMPPSPQLAPVVNFNIPEIIEEQVETPKDGLSDKKMNEIEETQNQTATILSGQRTGESSQVQSNNNEHSLMLNKTKLKMTVSLTADDPQSIQPAQETKIGPWSFIAHQLLGTGSFGEVYLVEKISNGHYYAMKVLSKAKIMSHNLTRYAMTERNVLSLATHPFIVKLHYAFQTQEKLFLILDYCPGGDLAEYLQLEKRFNEDKTRLYSSEILLALEELHRKDIIFRDLKPDNIVLDHDGHAMLTDFGLSKEGVYGIDAEAKSFCGSYAYLAPEMLRKVGHGKAVDWYLLGVVIYEMLCGIPPYYANNKEELFENIKHAHLEVPNYVSPVAKDLIVRLMHRNPQRRLGSLQGASEIKRHPFFKQIDWTKLEQRLYRPPEPYLRKRFENFLQLAPNLQTNVEVYEQLRRQALLVSKGSDAIDGWSFVSPRKQSTTSE